MEQVELLNGLLNEAKEALKQTVEYQKIERLQEELYKAIQQEKNVPLWSRLNKDVELYAMYTDLYTGDYIQEGNLRILKKGTYVEVYKEDPSIYLDNDGDGFLFFNPEDLDEVYLDPCCFYSSSDGIPDMVRKKESYPSWFNGNPEDWFSSEIEKVYQG